jgi:mono/diheme cytochrome c family protein
MAYSTARFARSALAASVLLCAGQLAAQQPGSAPLSPFQRAKAEALLEGKLPCLGCHALNGRGGRIGPDLSGVGARLDPARIRAQIMQPVGIMPRVVLPASTLELVVAYLSEQRSAATAPPLDVPRTSPAGSEADRLYGVHCAACHGTRGAGDGWNAPYLDRPPARHADARAMSARTDDRLFDGIHAGGGILGGTPRMPPFGGSLSTQQIRLLVGYIRELCRCRQPAWADAPR